VCPAKQRDQNIFYNICYKTQTIVMKSGTPFPEQFATVYF